MAATDLTPKDYYELGLDRPERPVIAPKPPSRGNGYPGETCLQAIERQRPLVFYRREVRKWQRAEMRRLRESGRSVESIAGEFGLAASSVRTYLAMAGYSSGKGIGRALTPRKGDASVIQGPAGTQGQSRKTEQ